MIFFELQGAFFAFFLIYILIKPDGRDDLFFVQKRQLSKSSLLQIISDLEIINNSDYSLVKRRIESYFADNKITEAESLLIEKQLINTYFKGFQRRMIPFIKADTVLKTIYSTGVVFSFYYFNLIIAAINGQDNPFDTHTLGIHIGLSVLLFVVPLLFWLIQLGFLSMILEALSMIFPDKGAVARAKVTLDEMIKLLKPGGRATPVELGNPTMDDWANGAGYF